MEYLVLLPIYLVAFFYLSVRVMKFIFDHIIPQAPGVIMDMLSNATETVAQKAFRMYQEILKEDSQPVYYGRVTSDRMWKATTGKACNIISFTRSTTGDWLPMASTITRVIGKWWRSI